MPCVGSPLSSRSSGPETPSIVDVLAGLQGLDRVRQLGVVVLVAGCGRDVLDRRLDVGTLGRAGSHGAEDAERHGVEVLRVERVRGPSAAPRSCRTALERLGRVRVPSGVAGRVPLAPSSVSSGIVSGIAGSNARPSAVNTFDGSKSPVRASAATDLPVRLLEVDDHVAIGAVRDDLLGLRVVRRQLRVIENRAGGRATVGLQVLDERVGDSLAVGVVATRRSRSSRPCRTPAPMASARTMPWSASEGAVRKT